MSPAPGQDASAPVAAATADAAAAGVATGAAAGAAAAALPIGLLAMAGFLSSAGARIIDPVLHPIATDFGITVAGASVVVAAFTLPYGLAQILLGPMGDRFGKLRVMLASLLAYAVVTACCALAGSLTALVALRALSGAVSAGLIPVAMAYIGDMVPYAQRQVTISRFLTGSVLALAMAGPVGGVFGSYLGWRGVFVLLGAAAGLVAAALWLRLRVLPDRRGAGGFNPRNYVLLARSRFARLLLLGALADGALLVGCFPFLAPYLHERFGLSYALVGVLLSFFGLGAFAYTRLAPRLLRWFGEAGMQLVGGGVIALSLAGAVLTPAWPVFLLTQTGIGFGFFTLHGVLQARATELLPNARATAVSTFAFMLFVGQSLGALTMGLGIAHLEYRDAFLCDAGAVVVLALLLSALVRRPQAAPAQEPAQEAAQEAAQ